jgi:hypothetical protein
MNKKFTIQMVKKEYFSGTIEASSKEEAKEKVQELWDEDLEKWAELFAEPVEFSSYDIVSVSETE